MKTLVIGYGSIGRRHARNARRLGHEVVLLRHGGHDPNPDGLREYYDFDEVLASEGCIDAAVVCSPTSGHLDDVAGLVERGIPFLLEKPPAVDLSATRRMRRLLERPGAPRYDIAFNMRYYPPLRFIRHRLSDMGRVYCAQVWAGAYLPDWRPGVDYRTTSSARAELGGGVHVELVHEIDYILWFFGMPVSVFATARRISDLEITTQDLCSAVLLYEDGMTVELHLDYLSRKRIRGCRVIARDATLEWDMGAGQISCVTDGSQCGDLQFSLDPGYDFNNTYVEELAHFTRVVDEGAAPAVDIHTALNAMMVLDAINASSLSGRCVGLAEIQVEQEVPA